MNASRPTGNWGGRIWAFSESRSEPQVERIPHIRIFEPGWKSGPKNGTPWM